MGARDPRLWPARLFLLEAPQGRRDPLGRTCNRRGLPRRATGAGVRAPTILVAVAAPAIAALVIAAPRLLETRPPARPAIERSAPGPGPDTEASEGIYGFHRDSLARQRAIEKLLSSLPETARVEQHARALTREPHVAGTPGNDRVARYICERFKEAGLETEMKTYSVYLGYVKSARLEQVEPERKRLANPESGVPEDKDAADPRAALNWNAYSPSCDLTREVVYVNYARPEDFDALERRGVPVKDRLVLARY